MKNILPDLSGKIEPIYLKALEKINEVSRKYGLSFIVIGAIARDLILEYYDIKPPIKTNDLDFGIKVSSWEEYNKLLKCLFSSSMFEKTNLEHRVKYDKKLYIDIIPFGNISRKDKILIWQQNDGTSLNLAGFEETYSSSINVKLSKNLIIKIPTLAGLTILKLISWDDGYPNREKDAKDILFIMNNYENTENFDRLYSNRNDILKKYDFDTNLACIYLFGSDIAKLAKSRTLNIIKKILCDEISESSRNRLVIQMMGNSSNFEEIIIKIKILNNGVIEKQRS